MAKVGGSHERESRSSRIRSIGTESRCYRTGIYTVCRHARSSFRTESLQAGAVKWLKVVNCLTPSCLGRDTGGNQSRSQEEVGGGGGGGFVGRGGGAVEELSLTLHCYNQNDFAFRWVA